MDKVIVHYFFKEVQKPANTLILKTNKHITTTTPLSIQRHKNQVTFTHSITICEKNVTF